MGAEAARPRRRRSVPIWAAAVLVVVAAAAGVFAGNTTSHGAKRLTVSTGEATLANRANWLTVFKAEGIEGALAFDARSVAWKDGDSYWDGFSGKVPPCLKVNRPVPMKVSYTYVTSTGDGSQGVVVEVECLPSS